MWLIASLIAFTNPFWSCFDAPFKVGIVEGGSRGTGPGCGTGRGGPGAGIGGFGSGGAGQSSSCVQRSRPWGSRKFMGSPCTYVYLFQLPGSPALLPLDGSAELNRPVPTA